MTEEPQLDPLRMRILERSRLMGLSLAAMSGAIQRNAGYMHQYIHRGAPRELPESVRRSLEVVLELAEGELLGERAAISENAKLSKRRLYVRTVSPVEDRTIPVFADTDRINLDVPTSYVSRTETVDNARFGIRISGHNGRLYPGDIAYATLNIPPRVGDMAIAVRDEIVVGIGQLVSLTDETAIVLDRSEPKTEPLFGLTLLKVIAVVFP